MACNCNTANPNCEPCAICTPPGVTCLTTCNPPDPCPDGSLDINCIIYNGINFPCASVKNGDTLISVLLEILAKIFPPDFCCDLQGNATNSTCGLGGTVSFFTPLTTSTSTSTTSTTTQAPIPCSFFEIRNTSQTGPSVFSYVPCNCLDRKTQTVGNTPLTVCVNNLFSITVVSGSVSPSSQQGPCTSPACPPTTTTSTSTTSTSTSTTSTTSSTTTTTTLCPCQRYTFTAGTGGNPTFFNVVSCPGQIPQGIGLAPGDPPVTRCINNAFPIIKKGGNGTFTPGECNCDATTTSTSTSTTSTTTTAPVPIKRLCFIVTLPDPTTTTSTSTTSTTSTSSTTSTTTIPIVGRISVFGEQGSGTDLQVTGYVQSGNVGNNLAFTGFVQRYSDALCTVTVGTPIAFNFTLFPGMTTFSQTGLGSVIGVQTLKIVSLVVNSIPITVNPQIINVSGSNYQITGFNDCAGL